MDEYFYSILPQEKAKSNCRKPEVCFVGNEINDAIGMKKENVSISLMGTSSIATNVAEVVLMVIQLLGKDF
jgi:Cu2+-exporting ATPase